ncbi:MAG: OB-fold protein [Candidatus Alkanophagales archaeon MCA70_species_2]|nr:OB-fold protein [Candidatus Alkanophaga liquidiphilum]RLG36351.1 MAG: hydroxymethylglutaryl-CoA synthase [Candidatus Alkanophagales archaeon]
MVGIIGYGVYIPMYRLKTEEIAGVWGGGGVGGVLERAVPGVDEDVITMAAEAAFNAFEHADVEPSEVEALFFATTSAPYAEGRLSSVLTDALGLKAETVKAELGFSARAGVVALWNCMNAIRAGELDTALVVASDSLVGAPGTSPECKLGAGAVAFLVGKDGMIADFGNFCTFSTDFPYRWRRNERIYVEEVDDMRVERDFGYVRHVSAAMHVLLQKSDTKLSDYQHVVLDQPDAQLPRALARALKLDGKRLRDEQWRHVLIAQEIGCAGAATCLISLAKTLDVAKPSEKILVVSYGAGAGSDVFELTVTERIEERRGWVKPVEEYLRRKEYVSYGVYERFLGIIRRAEEAPLVPSIPAYVRNMPYKLRLVGFKCKSCGEINLPRRRICRKCRKPSEFEEVKLSRKGSLYTFTIVEYGPPGLERKYAVGVAELKEGVRLIGRLTDCKPEDVKVGMPVELVLRKVIERGGLVEYGYAFRPLRGGAK